MKEVKINGNRYHVWTNPLVSYDKYYYKDSLNDTMPEHVIVTGYIVDNDERIAICAKSHKILFGVLFGVFVCIAVPICIYLWNIDYDFTVESNPFVRDVEVKLDKGVDKVERDFAYSRYATYTDGEVVIFYNTEDVNIDVSLKIGDTVTDFVPLTNRIEAELPMEVEDVVDAVLCVRRAGKVKEYPLIIEYPPTFVPETLAQGSIEDRDRAYNAFMEQSSESVEDVRTDYENFTVLKRRKVSNNE